MANKELLSTPLGKKFVETMEKNAKKMTTSLNEKN